MKSENLLLHTSKLNYLKNFWNVSWIFNKFKLYLYWMCDKLNYLIATVWPEFNTWLYTGIYILEPIWFSIKAFSKNSRHPKTFWSLFSRFEIAALDSSSKTKFWNFVRRMSLNKGEKISIDNNSKDVSKFGLRYDKWKMQ